MTKMVQRKKQQKIVKRQLAQARSESKYAYLIPVLQTQLRMSGQVKRYWTLLANEQLRKLKGKISHTYGISETNVSMPICEPILHGETYKIQKHHFEVG